MKRVGLVAGFLFLVSTTFGAGVAKAGEGADSTFGLAVTLGESIYALDGTAYRGPFNLEVVPSFGWAWVKLDLGLVTSLESVEIAGTHIGNWAFTFRPGARLTPPMLPLYVRFAVPLQIQRHDFDYGFMLGLGADIHLAGALGLVLEVDSALSKNLDWGSIGLPLEIRAGLSFSF